MPIMLMTLCPKNVTFIHKQKFACFSLPSTVYLLLFWIILIYLFDTGPTYTTKELNPSDGLDVVLDQMMFYKV